MTGVDDGVAAPFVRLCRECVAALPIDAAALSVYDSRGGWNLSAATDPTAGAIEELGFTLGEGPARDALMLYRPVLTPDLAASAQSWPMWGPEAVAAGFRSVYALPVQAGAVIVGTLSLYSRTRQSLSGEAVNGAARFAQAALVMVLDSVAGLGAADSTPPFRDERFFSARIFQASGMVMAQADLSAADALVRLRACAFDSGRSISDVAVDVVERRLRFEPDPPLVGGADSNREPK